MPTDKKPAVFAVVNDANGDIDFLRNLFAKLPQAVKAETGNSLDLVALIGNTPGPQMSAAELKEFDEKAWALLLDEFDANWQDWVKTKKVMNPAELGSYYALVDHAHPASDIFKQYIGIVDTGTIQQEGLLVPRFRNFYRDLGEAMKPARSQNIGVKVMGTNLLHVEALPSDSYLDWQRLQLNDIVVVATGLGEVTQAYDAPLLAYRSGKSPKEDELLYSTFYSNMREAEVILTTSVPEKKRLMDEQYYLIVAGQRFILPPTKAGIRESAYLPSKIFDELSHKFSYSPVGVYRFDGQGGFHWQFVWHPDSGEFKKAAEHEYRLHDDKRKEQTMHFRNGIPGLKPKPNADTPPPLPGKEPVEQQDAQGERHETGMKDVASQAKMSELETKVKDVTARAETAESQLNNALSDAEKLNDLLAGFVQIVDTRIKENNPELYAELESKTPIDRVNAYFSWMDTSFRTLADEHTKSLGEARKLGEEKTGLERQLEESRKHLDEARANAKRADDLIYDHADVFNLVRLIDADLRKAHPEFKDKDSVKNVISYLKSVNYNIDAEQKHVEALREQLRLERDTHASEIEVKDKDHETLAAQVNAAQTELEQEKTEHTKDIEQFETRIRGAAEGYDADIRREQDEVTKRDEELRGLRDNYDRAQRKIASLEQKLEKGLPADAAKQLQEQKEHYESELAQLRTKLAEKQTESDEEEQYKEEIGKSNTRLEETLIRYQVLFEKAREQSSNRHERLKACETALEALKAAGKTRSGETAKDNRAREIISKTLGELVELVTGFEGLIKEAHPGQIRVIGPSFVLKEYIDSGLAAKDFAAGTELAKINDAYVRLQSEFDALKAAGSMPADDSRVKELEELVKTQKETYQSMAGEAQESHERQLSEAEAKSVKERKEILARMDAQSKAIDAARKNYDSEIAKYKSEIAGLKAAGAKPVDDSKVNALEAKVAELEGERETIGKQHKQALGAAEDKYQKALAEANKRKKALDSADAKLKQAVARKDAQYESMETRYRSQLDGKDKEIVAVREELMAARSAVPIAPAELVAIVKNWTGKQAKVSVKPSKRLPAVLNSLYKVYEARFGKDSEQLEALSDVRDAMVAGGSHEKKANKLADVVTSYSSVFTKQNARQALNTMINAYVLSLNPEKFAKSHAKEYRLINCLRSGVPFDRVEALQIENLELSLNAMELQQQKAALEDAAEEIRKSYVEARLYNNILGANEFQNGEYKKALSLFSRAARIAPYEEHRKSVLLNVALTCIKIAETEQDDKKKERMCRRAQKCIDVQAPNDSLRIEYQWMCDKIKSSLDKPAA